MGTLFNCHVSSKKNWHLELKIFDTLYADFWQRSLFVHVHGTQMLSINFASIKFKFKNYFLLFCAKFI